ncbi:MAG TPA: hypothetical protein VFI42_21290, partial [Thermomicrobiaceae bacterium]|nr:hypothetical protein [Thermomicrobiaceae bacterium]
PSRPAPGSARSGAATAERLAQSWPQIKRDVKAANSRIAALLSSVDPVGIEGNQVILVSAYEFHRNKLNDDAARQVVEDVIARYLDGAHQLRCLAPDEARAHTQAQTPGIQEDARPFQAEPAAELDPQPAEAGDDEHLRAVKAIFNATELEPE